MSSGNRTIWQIPKVELDRVGVAYINAADRIVDKYNETWQPEAPETVIQQLGKDYINIECVLRNPPTGQQ